MITFIGDSKKRAEINYKNGQKISTKKMREIRRLLTNESRIAYPYAIQIDTRELKLVSIYNPTSEQSSDAQDYQNGRVARISAHVKGKHTSYYITWKKAK